MRLVLIDSRIDDITGISGSLTENTEYILFDYLTDTIASIQDKITNTYESVAIIQHNYKLPTYQLVSSSEVSKVVGLVTEDPNLETWKEYIGFLVWLKTEKGAEFIDLMACDLWADENWKYMIETVRARDGVYIRASIDRTGEGGNFVLESDGIDMVGVYFTEKILEYKYSFYYETSVSQGGERNFNYVFPKSNPGTVMSSVLPYSNLHDSLPTNTVTNVISAVCNYGAIAILRTDNTVITQGSGSAGGNMSTSGIVTQADLVNITKIVGSYQSFAALKTNGTVICWGSYNGTAVSGADINNNTDTSLINVNTVRSQLVDIVDIYSTAQTSYAAVTNTGKVITWGIKRTGGDISSISSSLSSGVSKIYTGYGIMAALKNNGTAAVWGNGGGTYYNYLSSTNFTLGYPIVDILMQPVTLESTVRPYYVVTVGGDYRIYAYNATPTGGTGGIPTPPIYTIPTGHRILRKNWVDYANNVGIYLILSNETIVFIKSSDNSTTTYLNAIDVRSNQGAVAILFKDSTVQTFGSADYGGNTSHATRGLWSGANTNNAFRLMSSGKSMGLLKTDKNFVWWGMNNIIDSTNFPTKDGANNTNVTAMYGNVISGNIIGVYPSIQQDYYLTKTDNKVYRLGNSPYYNRSITKPANTNIYYQTTASMSASAYGSLIPIEIPYSPKVTPYFVIINKATSISYYVSNPDYMAYEGRIYRLYYGATLIDTFIPTSDTHTYVFSNVTMTTIGKFTLEIFDYTMATPVSMATFSLSAYNYDFLYSVAGTVNTSGSITPTTLASATFNTPGEIAFDSINNMYIADTNNHVIRVVPAQNGTLYGVNVFVGNTYVVAGTGASGTNIANGTSNLSCTLNSPYGVAFDSNDNMFISDTNNHVVRVIPKTGGSIYGVSTTANQSFVVAGTGMAGTTATLPTSFGVISNNSEGTNMTLSTSALGIAVSDDGTRMAFCISSTASVSPISIFFYRKYDGNSWSTNQAFTIQSATSFTPYATYVSMTPSGNRVVFGCASGPWYYSDWGTTSYGPLIVINASVNCRGICITADGTRVITFNDAAGSSTLRYATYTGSGFGASQSVASMTGTRTIACTRDGNRVVTCKYAAGEAPNLVSLYTWNGATYVSASTTADTTERAYRGFSFSADGHILFSASENTANIKYALWNGANYGVFADVPNTKLALFNSVFHTTSSTTGATTLYSLTTGGDWYTTSISHPWSVNPINLKLNYPRGIAIDALNRLYIADTSNHIIKVILPTTMTPYQIYGRTLLPNTTYIIGTDGVSGSSANDVDASNNARLNSPYDIMVDSSQNLFISDSSNNVVRVVSNITGTIFNNTVVPNKMYIVAGNAAATSTSGVGSGILASDSTVQLFSPRGLAMDENRHLFISDSGSHSIRVISNKTGTIGTTSTTKNFIYTLIGTLNTPYANGNPTTNILNSSSTLNSPSSCLYNSAEKSMYISDTGTHSIRQAVYYKLPSAPGSPIINSLIGGNTTLTLTYSAGDDGGSAITNYYYAIKDGSAPQSAYATIGSSPQTLSNLKNGNTYTISLIAQNSLGNSTASNATATPYTFPSTPSLTSIASGNSSLTVTLNATISNGGNAITTYYYSIDNGDTYTSSSNDTSNPYTISGLTNGNTYTVRLITTNFAGNSSPSNALTATAYTTPDKPIISSITGGNARLVVTLDNTVFNGGNAYTTYFYSINNGETYTSTGGNVANPYTISSGLTNGNTYSVSFITRNAAGNSVASDPFSAIPLTFPGAPVINAIIPGDTTFDVSFGAPLTDGGNAITNYWYSLFQDSSYVSLGPTPTVFPVPDLSNGTPYTIYMIATNSVGNTVVPSSRTATPRTVPDAPIINTLIPKNTAIDISFSAPAFNGGNAITNYWYSFFSDSSYNPMGATPTTYTVPDLFNGTMYTIYVKATNAAGNTLVASNATAIPRTIPSEPIITTFIPGNRTIDISFNAPSSDGGNTITDYAYSFFQDTSYNSIGPVPIQYQIQDLSNGTPYRIYLKAYNAAGNTLIASNAVAIPRTVPDAPIINRLIPKNTAIDISFSAPAFDGGNAITEYKYSFFSDSSYNSMGVTPTTYTVSDLSNGTMYTIYVKATNAAGDTLIAANAIVIPRTVPSEPIITTFIPGNRTIDISFNAPSSDGGNAITDYAYSFFPDTSYNSIGPVPIQYQIPDLSNGTPYTIYLKAYNDAGNTLIASNSVATPRTVPGAPIVKAVILKNTAIDISFGAPTSDGGNAITDYAYSFFLDSSYSSMGSTPTVYPITDLSNGTSYTIYLRATNDAGNTITASSVTAIPRTVPDAPVINTLIPKNTAIDISFSAPAFDGGNAITDYVYSFFPDSSYNSMGAIPTTYTVSDLSNGTMYTIYVKATNAAGDTLISANSTAIPRTVPSEPIITTFIPGNTTIDLSFNAPSSDGGNAITDYAYSFFPDTSYNSMGPVPIQYQISDLSNGTLYKIYLKAYNDAGNTLIASNSFAIPRTVPDAPIINRLIPKNTAIDISFSAPAFDGGNAITNYWYSLFSDSSYNSMGATPTTYTVPNLFNGTMYTIYVKATNAAGNTLIAANSTAIPRTVPSEPIITTFIPGNRTIDISFNAPSSDGGNAITDYAYSFFQDSSYVSIGSVPLQYQIQDLSNGTPYTIYLKAYNAAGNTVIASNSVAIPRTVPDAPIINTLIPKNTAIDISFSAPAFDGGNAITDYAYSFFSDSSYNSMGATPTTYTVSDLSNGTMYTIYVKATNAAGNTLIASNSTAIPRTIPDAPIITHVILGNTTIDISFNAPVSDGGNAITDYRYSFFPDSDYNESVGFSPTRFPITDLSNGTSYTIYMKAYNAAGNTLIASNVVAIPRTVPDAPEIKAVTFGNTFIDISFGAPLTDGGNAITNYWYSFYSDSSYNPMNTSSPTTYRVSGLRNGTSYTIYLKASNDAGNTFVASTATETPKTFPGAPVINLLTAGDQVVDISFSAPSDDGGNAITNYWYSLYQDSSYNPMGPTPSIYRVTGLTNGATYTFYLKATNSVGNTINPSSATISPLSIPGAPVIKETIPGNRTIDISFATPINIGGSPIIDYKYSFFSDSSYVSLGPIPTMISLSDLSNGTPYTIYLKATNAAGDTAIPSSTTSTPRTFPDAPIINTLILKNGAIDISFSAPAFNGGNAITNYWYSLFPDTSYNSMGATPTTYPVSGLTNGTSYTIYVKATNAAGNTLIAANSTAIPRTVPTAPIITTFIPGNTTIDLSFNAPSSDGGNAITGYGYSFFQDSSYVSIGPAPTTYTVVGLTNGISYRIYLKAFNDAGNTLIASNAVAIPYTTPDTPILTSVVGGNTTLTVSLNNSVFNGGNAYTTYYYSTDNGNSYTSSNNVVTNPYIITGLTNGNTYDVRFITRNNAGNSNSSTALTGIPYTLPDTPIIDGLFPGNNTLTANVIVPFNGGNTVSAYNYTLVFDTSNATYVNAKSFSNTSSNNFTASNNITDIAINDAGDRIAYAMWVDQGVSVVKNMYKESGNWVTKTPSSNINNGSFPRWAHIAMTSNGDTIFFCGYSNTQLFRGVWNNGTKTYDINTIDNTQRYYFGVSVTADGKRLVTSSADSNNGSITIRTLTSPNVATYTTQADTISTTLISVRVKLTRDGSRLVYGSLQGGGSRIFVSNWDGAKYPVGTVTEDTNLRRYGSFAFSPDNNILLALALYPGASTNPIFFHAKWTGNNYSTCANVASTSLGISNQDSGEQTLAMAWQGQTDKIYIARYSPTDSKIYVVDGSFNKTYTTSNEITLPSSSVQTISGLTNKKQYIISVKAQNAAGNSNVSGNSIGIPSKSSNPPTLNSLVPGNMSITVNLTEPVLDVDTTQAINYYYTINGSTYLLGAAGQTQYTISNNITNGNTYTISLIAQNNTGNSSPSNALTVTPYTTPDKPIITSITVGNARLVVSLDTSVFNGGNALTTYYYSTNNGNTYTSTGGNISNPYTISSGLTNGATYLVSFIATNMAGNSVASDSVSVIPNTIPGAPVIKSITPGNRTIDVSFGAPISDGGNAITDYAYSFFLDSSYVSLGPTPTEFQLIDLSNGTPYTIYLKAYNSIGNTAVPSSATVTPRTFPDAPVINAIILKNAAIDISFSAPANNGGNAITDYKYSFNPDSSYNSMGATPTTYTVPDLSNGTMYTIYVKATNAAGDTLIAANSTAIPRTVPSAPIITHVILGNTTVDISFNAPVSDGGNAITEYRYSFFPNSEYNESVGTRFQIAGLTNGNSYTIYLKAYNAAGNTLIAANTVVIPRTVPGAPIINTLIPKNGAIDISFSAPAVNGGNAITNYWYSFDQYSSYVSMEISTPRLYTVPNLTNGNTYTIYMKATNAAGNTFVESSATAIPRTVPSEPIITTFIPGNRTIDISFNAPSSDGGNAITDYAYSFFSDSSYVSIGPVPIQYQITDLSNGTPYTIYLKAYNAAGNTVTSSSSTAIPRTVPSAPQIKEVILKDSAIDVSFGAPISDGGNAITEYAYSFFPDSAYNSMGTSPTVYTIPGLTNGRSYTIYFKAFNSAGNTLIASNTIAIPRTIPGAPVIKAVTLKDSAIDISFGEPVSTGGNAITEYKYSFFPDSSYNSMGAVPTVHTVPGLTNGISYKIYLKAYNAAGNTLIASNLVAIPRTVPGAPQIKPATFGNTFIDVSFGAPISDGGNAITNYWFSFFSDSSYNPMNTSSPTTYRVSGLTNGTSYTIYLKASNAAGNTITASSVTAIPKTFPGAPIITAATPGNASVSITFSAPTNDGGNAITEYSYSYFSDSSYNPIGPSPTTFPISGLNNGTSYTIYLKATNSVGSTINAARTTLTPRTVPTAPTIDTIIPIDSALQVSLLPPTNNGGSSITGYYYTVDGGTPVFGTTAVNTVFNIPGLVNGTSYSIAVLAENAAGLSVASASVLRVPYTLPDSPIVDNIVYDANTITLTLNEPSSGGNAITGYYYEIANGGLQYIGNVAGIYIIGGLANSRNTTVYIYALNAAGYSAPFIILSQNVSDEPENVPNIIRFRSAFSNNLAYYKPGSLSTSGGGSGVTNARAVKLRT